MSPFSVLSALVSTVLVATSMVAAQYPNPGPVSGATFVHDPTMVKVGGTYFLYATAPGISIKTSTDRTNFRDAGLAFPNGLPWCDSYTESSRNIWAPEVKYMNNQFYLYYSCSSFGSRHSATFLATSKTGLSGSWTNKGKVYSTEQGSNFNAIDPALLVDGGKAWLTLGSFGSGIYQIPVNPSTGLAASTSLTHIAQRTAEGTAIEGAFILKQGGYYYLFAAFGKCCQGASSTYRVVVGRSSSPTGPFADKSGVSMLQGGGTVILDSHGSIHGPGGASAFQDSDGTVLVYHYYANDGSARLGINKLDFSRGWPVVV
ncbi:uncharacterized protein PFL1_04442 [Pseudozyma flocculosa PF-1]|uniref:Arabinan endo-1,5-alpha-L-arabinosidase n=2 Tax=Pseudozyma flocculosa TaxID=84751 RepID=A0A5C3FBY8_9BASI|nr:uncharacterized protein PFL1_04442 [Pseudozyma flocculosa PF-1]EPQ28115.1 hypothetical protein PFL1_04442 [Pseudozyma flocculosa PF-1]SPO41912.1 related to arabinan endo-1,5-alpha-L-arabinosidase A precursor [Pseudozyma flocculosa]